MAFKLSEGFDIKYEINLLLSWGVHMRILRKL